MEQNINNAPDSAKVRGSEIEALIEDWFVASLHNSPVSRATEIFNHVRVAVDALKQRLGAFLQEH